MADSVLLRAIKAVGPEAVYASIPDSARAQFKYEWRAWARPEQLAPTDRPWRIWLILAGRNFGKTRSGAEWVRERVESGQAKRVALVGRTAGDVRDVIVEGESGILACSPPWFRPLYEPSKRRLTWPNGAIATTYSADEPNSLRGPQHDSGWADEIAAWNDPDAWDQFMFGLRLGDNPQAVATTTPRPTDLVKTLLADPTTAVSRGTTFDNAANVSPGVLAAFLAKYEGTRLGRQELYAELLIDTEGALWSADSINASRVKRAPPSLVRCVVGVDPSGSSHRKSDEAGVVTAGLALCGCKGNPRDLHGFVLADNSGVMSPDSWGREAALAFHRYRADKVLGERNYGGDMVETIVRHADNSVVYGDVVASRGKAVRAAPIAALYEQGRVHHVGYLAELEDEMTTFNPLTSAISPGRMDALVFALTDMMGALEVGDPGNITTEGQQRWSRAGGIL